MLGQSKLKGAQAVQAIMTLDATISSEREEVSRLHSLTQSGTAAMDSAFDDLRSTRVYLNALIARRARLFDALGHPDTTSLLHIKRSVFLQQRMNALAVKHRLRDKLRQRKFENERLERAYRRTVNGMLSSTLSSFSDQIYRVEAQEAHCRIYAAL